MANQGSLTSWVFENRELVGLEVSVFNWPDRLFDRGSGGRVSGRLQDFEVSFKIRNLRAIGRGIHPQQDIAFEKACAEAIERLICSHQRISSTGISLTVDQRSKDHAQAECLEHFYIQKHLQLGVAPRRCQDIDEMTPELKNIFRQKSPETFLEFFRLDTPLHLFGVVCQIHHPQTGIFIGTALTQLHAVEAQSSLAIMETLDHSFFEAASNYSFALDQDAADSGPQLPEFHLQSKLARLINRSSEEWKQPENRTEFEKLHRNLPKLNEIAIPIEEVPAIHLCPFLNVSKFVVSEYSHEGIWQ